MNSARMTSHMGDSPLSYARYFLDSAHMTDIKQRAYDSPHERQRDVICALSMNSAHMTAQLGDSKLSYAHYRFDSTHMTVVGYVICTLNVRYYRYRVIYDVAVVELVQRAYDNNQRAYEEMRYVIRALTKPQQKIARV